MQSLWLLVLCACAGSVWGDLDNNSTESVPQWQRTEHLMSVFELLHDRIAHKSKDDAIQSKRLFSILASGVLQRIKRRQNIDWKTGRADVIAGKVRALLNLLKAIVDPSVNIVKRVCSPETSVSMCRNLLDKKEEWTTKQCPNFSNHSRLRVTLEMLALSPAIKKLYEDMVKYSETGNEAEADLYLEYIQAENRGAVLSLARLYQRFSRKVRHGKYTCFNLNV